MCTNKIGKVFVKNIDFNFPMRYGNFMSKNTNTAFAKFEYFCLFDYDIALLDVTDSL